MNTKWLFEEKFLDRTLTTYPLSETGGVLNSRETGTDYERGADLMHWEEK